MANKNLIGRRRKIIDTAVADAILDDYIQNMSLYELLGGEEYLQQAEAARALFHSYFQTENELLEA